MERTHIRRALLAIALFAAAGCSQDRGAKTATTTTTLEAAVRDLLGHDAELLSLAGPGMCPGHFDIQPSQVQRLRRCELVLRMDFQASLDEKIGPDPRIAPIRVSGGLCVPQTYLQICRQVADAMVAADQLDSQTSDKKLALIANRVNQAGVEAKQQIDDAGLTGAKVLVSRHQADFCRYLGMEVVAELPAGDEASVKAIDQVITVGRREGVRWVVANRPEGTQAADAIGKSLRAGVIVLENFPDPEAPNAFDLLLRHNVAILTAAAEATARD